MNAEKYTKENDELNKGTSHSCKKRSVIAASKGYLRQLVDLPKSAIFYASIIFVLLANTKLAAQNIGAEPSNGSVSKVSTATPKEQKDADQA